MVRELNVKVREHSTTKYVEFFKTVLTTYLKVNKKIVYLTDEEDN